MKGQRGKSPAVQWYYKDWLSDARLQMATASTRGIWINLLMFMIDRAAENIELETTGLRLTMRELCQLGACSEADANRFEIDAKRLGFCQFRGGFGGVFKGDMSKSVFILSRRIEREYGQRKKFREIKRLQREAKAKKQPQKTPVLEPVLDGVSPLSSLSPTPSPTPTPTGYKEKAPSGAKKKPAPKPKAKPRAKPFVAPTLSAVVSYFGANGYKAEAATNAWHYYEEMNPPWHDSQGKPVKSWKAKMRAVWFKPEHKQGGNNQPATYAQCQDLERRGMAHDVLSRERGGHDAAADQRHALQDGACVPVWPDDQ